MATSPKLLSREFRPRTEAAFAPVAAELGLDGPGWSEFVLPALTWFGAGLRYEVSYDAFGQYVETSVERDDGRTQLRAPLGRLLNAAGLAPPGALSETVRTLHELDLVVSRSAGYVRALHPRLSAPDGENLLRAAGARERRPPDPPDL